jgi:hypothetical protein
MKTKLNHIGIIKQSLGWLAVFAGAGLAVGVLNYRELDQQIALGEINSELSQTMIQVAHDNVLLHQLGEGQLDEAKKEVSYRLSSNMAQVNILSASTTPATQEFARQVIIQVSHDKLKHPDYYLAAAGLEKIPTGEVVQVVRH